MAKKPPSLPNVNVIPDPTGRTTGEILAASIKEIADGVRKLRTAGLTDKAIEVLVKNTTAGSSVPITDVRLVLRAIDTLEVEYLTKGKRNG